jgi:hypothetical protein
METASTQSRTLGALLFAALAATALSLGPALAHLLELPNKIGLVRDQYFTVQSIYRGWNLIAIVLLVQLVTIIGALILARRERRLALLLAVALVGLVAAQIVFWAFTFPANAATSNWTVVPDNWEPLRRQWEYSHAAGAVFQYISLLSLAFAALRYRSP